MKTIFPKFFSFEGAGILLFDKAQGVLFCMEQVYTEEQQNEIDLVREKKNKGQALSPDEILKDFERQLKPGDKRTYPTTLGATGEAFRNHKVIFTNEIRMLTNFLPSIDNLSADIKDVR